MVILAPSFALPPQPGLPGSIAGKRRRRGHPLSTSPTYLALVSGIGGCGKDFNIRAMLKSGPTLCSLLTRVKDPLPMEKQANVVYEVLCTCGKVYIGKTTRRLETRLKEHKDACIKGFTDKSAIAEHAWTEDHPIRWGDTRIMQHASQAMELVVKEGICIRTTPESSHFNRDGRYNTPDCWIATYRKLKGGTHAGCTHLRASKVDRKGQLATARASKPRVSYKSRSPTP